MITLFLLRGNTLEDRMVPELNLFTALEAITKCQHLNNHLESVRQIDHILRDTYINNLINIKGT